MITAFIKTLWASELFRQGLALLAAFFIGWYLIASYNEWVIEEALQKNDKEWSTKLDEEKEKHVDYIAAQEVERAKLVAENAKKVKDAQAKYDDAIRQVNVVSADKSRLAGLLAAATRDNSTPDADGKCGAVPRLQGALQSCEQSLGRTITIARDAATRAFKASAGLEALSK